MSILIMTQVFAKSFGTASRKLLAVKLADHADDRGRGIWPSKRRLAEACEMSEGSIRRLLREFEAEGLLIRIRDGGEGPGSTNRWDMDLERLAEYPDATAHADSGSDEGVHHGPLIRGKGSNGDAKGSNGDAKGSIPDPQTVIEPSSNHHSLRASADEPSMPADAGEREDDDPGSEDGVVDGRAIDRAFKRFAPSWPSWVSDSAPEARRAWGELSDTERAAAAELAPVYLAAERDAGRTKSCSLSKYLREKRWEKLAAPAPKASGLVEFAPFGKGWMAWRLRMLETAIPREWQPTAAQRSIARTRPDLVQGPRRQGRFPTVHTLDVDASRGVPARVRLDQKPPVEAEFGGYVTIRRDSSQWEAWEAYHHARDWPWIDPPAAIEWVHVPAEWPPVEAESEAAE